MTDAEKLLHRQVAEALGCRCANDFPNSVEMREDECRPGRLGAKCPLCGRIWGRPLRQDEVKAN